MSTPNHLNSKHATAVELGETGPVDQTLAQLRDTRAELDEVRRELASLRAAVDQLTAKSIATCKKCGATYDMFSHHYSIGLFDNIVYVKCPHCQTPMPVDPRLGVRAE
jgi:hypothetical protein